MTDMGIGIDIGSPFGTVIAAAQDPVTGFPTGVVTGVSTTTLTVNVGGVNLNAAYLSSYLPRVGDLVALGRNDATRLVLGSLAGVGPNAVANPSFEADGAITGVPSSWNFASLAGAPSVSVQATGFAVDGTHELVVSASTGAPQDSYVYSGPIAVAPGQQWAAAGYATAVYPVGDPQTAVASLYGLWFANDTNLYPTTSSADTLIGQVVNLSAAPSHASVSGTVTVPAGAAYMRVALRSVSAASVSLAWDLVTARRVG
jgi:hypothetical protein